MKEEEEEETWGGGCVCPESEQVPTFDDYHSGQHAKGQRISVYGVVYHTGSLFTEIEKLQPWLLLHFQNS